MTPLKLPDFLGYSHELQALLLTLQKVFPDDLIQMWVDTGGRIRIFGWRDKFRCHFDAGTYFRRYGSTAAERVSEMVRRIQEARSHGNRSPI